MGAGGGLGAAGVVELGIVGSLATVVEDPPLDALGTVVEEEPADPARSAAIMDLDHGSGTTFRLVLIFPGVAKGCTTVPVRYGAMNSRQTLPATVPP